MAMHFAWEAWTSHGWTEADLVLVVKHIKKLIGLNRRRPESLRFYNLIGDTERFLEDVSEARALNRAPKPTAKDIIRPQRERDTSRTAAQIMAGNEALKKLLEVRDEL